MKKQILLGAFLLGTLFTANAQDSCAGAVVVTPGTHTVGTINGTFVAGCFETTAPTGANAEWYSYTPTENTMVTITTDLDVNVDPNSEDTRISIFTGTCAGLTCYAGNDDINSNTEEYLSTVTFPAAANTTYYIAFEDAWSDAGFQFELTSVPTSCFTPLGFAYVENPTTTTVSIEWEAPLVGTATGYEFEYGPLDYEQGTGTDATVTGMQVDLTDLTPSTDYEFYIRSVCGDGNYSEWVGPISFNTVFEPTTVPYTYGFETNSLGGWTAARAGTTGASWTIFPGTTATPAQEGDTMMAAGANGGASDAYLFSRGVNLVANQQAVLTFYVRKIVGAGAGNVNNLEVTVGNAATIPAQTTSLLTLNDFTQTEWTLQTVTFTPSTAGVYHFAFNYTGAGQTNANFGRLAVDNVTISQVLGTNDVLASQFSVFPNPTTGVINIANAENILVNGVEIVDINGRTVKTAKFDNVSEAQINISDLASGMYLMNISSDKGTTTKKIVKN